MIDVLVVGGGPAGLAAAIEAASSGFEVCLVEPRAFPIDRACGEGLMPAALRSLDRMGAKRPPGLPFEGIKMISNGSSAEGRFSSGPGLAAKRTDLSRTLHERARELGVQFVSDRISSVKLAGDYVEANGMQARWLIAADGLHSAVRRTLGLELKEGSRARRGLNKHFQTPPWSSFVEIYLAPKGEAYVAPLSTGEVGVAILSSTGGTFDEKLRAFPVLGERLSNPIGPEKGAGPFPRWIEQKAHSRILFVGDAAGFNDPITGEGMRLGFDAARAAVAAIRMGDTRQYELAWRRLTRLYWLITNGLVAIRQRQSLDRLLIPTLHKSPWLFDRVLNLLGERDPMRLNDQE